MGGPNSLLQAPSFLATPPQLGHSISNQRKTNKTPPEFLQIWCGEGVYGLTQPHQILSETIKYSWICGHLNVAISA